LALGCLMMRFLLLIFSVSAIIYQCEHCGQRHDTETDGEFHAELGPSSDLDRFGRPADLPQYPEGRCPSCGWHASNFFTVGVTPKEWYTGAGECPEGDSGCPSDDSSDDGDGHDHDHDHGHGDDDDDSSSNAATLSVLGLLGPLVLVN